MSWGQMLNKVVQLFILILNVVRVLDPPLEKSKTEYLLTLFKILFDHINLYISGYIDYLQAYIDHFLIFAPLHSLLLNRFEHFIPV